MAKYYGYSSSGYATAISHWNAIPANEKHPGDNNPPPGALVFWSGNLGHVALSVGNGEVVSTDYPHSGMVSKTPISTITNGWGKSYLGWSVPVFQGQVSQAGFNPSGPLGGLVGGVVGGSTILDFLTGKFGTDVKDMLQRLSLMVLGGVLITLGIMSVAQGRIKGIIKEEKSARNTAKEETNNAVDETGKEVETKAGS